jgi:hypothetical protein
MDEIDGRGKSVPLTDRERAARHFGVDVSEVTAEMIEKLPARGTGLEIEKAIGDDVDIEMAVGMFLLLHSVPHMDMASSPGIVIDRDIAASTPCRCARVGESEICFSRGVVGALDPGQKEAYCKPRVYFESPGLEKRLGEFKEAVAAAQEKIKDVPKGERLEPWLSAMSEELEKRGIEI